MDKIVSKFKLSSDLENSFVIAPENESNISELSEAIAGIQQALETITGKLNDLEDRIAAIESYNEEEENPENSSHA
jgi:uncharacterized coiled-coil protein SlyX